jgi:AcrR family transcriptional regulator
MVVGEERDTRERILQAAEAAIGQFGYYGTRLHYIAERVGIQKASLFHYFPNKDRLYGEVVARAVSDTEHVIDRVLKCEASPADKVRMLIEAYVDLLVAHPDRAKVLVRQSLGDAPTSHRRFPEMHRLLCAVAAFLADGQQQQMFRPIDPVAFVTGVVGMVNLLLSAGPVLIPAWQDGRGNVDVVQQVKQHVLGVVMRCLETADRRYADAVALAPS